MDNVDADQAPVMALIIPNRPSSSTLEHQPIHIRSPAHTHQMPMVRVGVTGSRTGLQHHVAPVDPLPRHQHHVPIMGMTTPLDTRKQFLRIHIMSIIGGLPLRPNGLSVSHMITRTSHTFKGTKTKAGHRDHH